MVGALRGAARAPGPQGCAWPGSGPETAPADGGGWAAAAGDAAGPCLAKTVGAGAAALRAQTLPKAAPSTANAADHDTRGARTMAAAPAPPPRKTKDQPPPVPKRGGKRMSFATERVTGRGPDPPARRPRGQSSTVRKMY